MLERFKTSRFFVFLKKVGWLPQDAFPLLMVLSVVGFYLINPDKFQTMWIGYAVFVYIAFFAVLTWLFYRQIPKKQAAESRVFWLGALSFFAGMCIYQMLIYIGVLPTYISQLGAALGIKGWYLDVSWPTTFDLLIFTTYLVGLIVSFFSVKSLRYFLGPVLYSGALVVFFVIDAVVPQNTFADAAFEFFVPGLVSISAGLLHMLNVNMEIVGNGSIMHITKPTGSAYVQVNWPCAGIHSLLIYTAIAVAFLQFLDISKMRKIIYASIGFFGTIFVNILRITSIVYAYYYFDVSIQTFHAYSGELFFISWMVIFLFAVTMVERAWPSREQRKEEN